MEQQQMWTCKIQAEFGQLLWSTLLLFKQSCESELTEATPKLKAVKKFSFDKMLDATTPYFSPKSARPCVPVTCKYFEAMAAKNHIWNLDYV